MASHIKAEWIQVRLDLASNPKVTRMVDLLAKSLGLYVLAVSTDDLFSGTRPVTCPVTSIVTRHALIDVTVGGLIRTWGAANTFIKDGTVPHARLDWVDDQSKIPGFGKAMAKVGWVIELPDGGLEFPNFEEWNRPKTNDLRSNDAVRKQRQRLQKWLAENPKTHPEYAAKLAALSHIESRDMSRDTSVTVPPTKERKEKLPEGTHPPRARPASVPSTEAQAIEQAALAGVPADYASTIYHEQEGINWLDSAGRSVVNWQSYVKARHNQHVNRQGGQRPPAGGKAGTTVEAPLTRSAAYARWMQAKEEAKTLKSKTFTDDTAREAAKARLHALERIITQLESDHQFTN